MNKVNLISILLILFINCSCDRTGIAYNIYEEKLINQTDKELFMASYFDVKNDSAFCHSNDSISLIFVKKVNWSMPFAGPYNFDEGEYPQQIKSIIYNLSDTTSFIGRSMTEDEKKLIILKYTLGSRHHTSKLYVTNGFLTLFGKDYTMLEEFKDYYKK